MKVELPSFGGNFDIEAFMDWLYKVGKFFEMANMPEANQLKFVAYRLKGEAATWWDQTQNTRRRQGKQPVRVWRRMKQLLRARFLPPDYQQILYNQFEQCHQGVGSVSTYTEELFRLTSRCDLSMSEEQLAAKYIGGLKYSIQEKVAIHNVYSVDEAHNMALKAKRLASKTPPFRRTDQGSSAEKARDYEEAEDGHTTSEEEYEEEGVEVKGDNVSCVVQRLLCAQKTPDSSRQHQIFFSRCSVNNKVCTLIVDKGSYENIVSKALVDHLKLLTETKHVPYTIGWIKKGPSMKVTELCRVPLSLGKTYNDSITYDVVDMNAYHVLLGRSWQYDVETKHGSKKNEYSFVWMNKKIILPPIPSSPKNPKDQKSKHISLCNKGEFLAESKELK
ncbi:uncharacterized protein LOC109823419 [Asparagus officinalis]|uniref:uncharacterized protein LOC109823419 n=1 Tax=Asparagus officinalis TaxID=4686 RepID=UPI00098E824B|nr:uncharacterized protein LOC109823419 [Asparagus officinalis]